MLQFPFVIITEEMLREANALIPSTEVKRTVASSIDTLSGHLGEFVFAAYLFGDWKLHRVGKNKGESDFDNYEVKTSAFPLNNRLNLLVREDYAQKRKPDYYVQIIIDVKDAKANSIPSGTCAYLCGYATATEVDNAPLKDFGSKLESKGGYRCHYIPITQLKPVSELLRSK